MIQNLFLFSLENLNNSLVLVLDQSTEFLHHVLLLLFLCVNFIAEFSALGSVNHFQLNKLLAPLSNFRKSALKFAIFITLLRVGQSDLAFTREDNFVNELDKVQGRYFYVGCISFVIASINS